MSTPSYPNVLPLAQDPRYSGRGVTVTFRCPVSGESVPARHTMPPNTAMTSRIGSTVQRSLMWSVRSAIASTLRSVFGGGVVGRLAGDIAYSAMNEVTREQTGNNLSNDEKQQALVEAFQSVRGRFVWNPNHSTWVSVKVAAELLSPFERLLNEAPVAHAYDRKVLGRMLIELARADGDLAGEEQSWLTDVITADMGSIGELAKRPPLTDAELRNVSRGAVRKTLLATAWALALVDETFDPAERQALDRYAKGLQLTAADLHAAREAAEGYVLDQSIERMFTWGGQDDQSRVQLFNLSRRLGISDEDALEAEARWQRRRA